MKALKTPFRKGKNALKTFLFKNMFGFVTKILAPITLITFILQMTPDAIWYPGMEYETWILSLKDGFLSGNTTSANLELGGVCWSCGIFSSVMQAFIYVAENLTKYLVNFCMVFIFFVSSFWILKRTFEAMVKNHGKDGESAVDYYKEIWKKVIWIGGVIAILISIKTVDVMHYLVMPALNLGTGVANTMLETDGKICKRFVDSQNGIQTDVTNDYIKKNVNSDPLVGGTNGKKDRGYNRKVKTRGNRLVKNYSNEVNYEMFCLLSAVDTMLMSGISAGKTAVAMTSWNSVIDKIVALLMIAGFFILYLLIPFFLIDIIFTIGFFLVLFPLMVVGTVWEKTKGMWQTGLGYLKYIAFYLIIFSIFINIIFVAFYQVADTFYPAKRDGFTYIFPDYFIKKTGQTVRKQVVANEVVKCLNSKGNTHQEMKIALQNRERQRIIALKKGENFRAKNIKKYNPKLGNYKRKIKSCYKEIGEKHKIFGEAGADWQSLLPILVLTILAIFLMSKIRDYVGWIGGGSGIEIGSDLLKLTKGLYKRGTGVAKDAGQSLMKTKQGSGALKTMQGWFKRK